MLGKLKLGSLGSLGGAKQSMPGVLRAAITGAINFAADIRQTNLIGSAISAAISVATDITLSSANQIGATISVTVIFAGDIASASAWDYDAEYMLNF